MTLKRDATMSDHKPDNAELARGSLVDRLTCGLPAEITDRFTLGGAPEPVDHLKVVCVRRHWYTLPVDMFPASGRVSEHTSSVGIRQRQ
jgi:hypothetical protein